MPTAPSPCEMALAPGETVDFGNVCLGDGHMIGCSTRMLTGCSDRRIAA